jgi:hypothetical protein
LETSGNVAAATHPRPQGRDADGRDWNYIRGHATNPALAPLRLPAMSAFAPPGSISASSNNQLNITLVNTFNSRITDNVVHVGVNYKFE